MECEVHIQPSLHTLAEVNEILASWCEEFGLTGVPKLHSDEYEEDPEQIDFDFDMLQSMLSAIPGYIFVVDEDFLGLAPEPTEEPKG